MKLGEKALSDLLRAADSGPVDSLGGVIRDVLADAGFRDAILYLSDYDENLLTPLPDCSGGGGRSASLKMESTLPGRAYRTRQLVQDEGPDAHRLWVPVIERSEPFGVLELDLESIDEDMRRLALDTGVMIGHMLVTARGYTDVYEQLRRRRDMNLAAEMHWDILPARNYIGPSISICGDIEPAYEVGGDAFDYSLNNRSLDITIMDAMGHGLEAALLSTQSVAAYRYARRRNAPITGIARAIDDALTRQFEGEQFVTGFFGRLDLSTGDFRWVSAGHVPPLLLRERRVEGHLDTTPGCPMGLQLLDDLPTHAITLRRDDCLVLYSDGVVEAKTPAGEHFTLERLAALVVEQEIGPGSASEIVHKVIKEVMLHSNGPLQDDATCVLVHYGGPN